MPQTTSTKAGLDALLTPQNSALILIDHQPFQFANLHSHEPTMVVNNVIGLAKTAKAFNVPTILTTVLEPRGGYPDQRPAGRLPRSEAHRPHLHQYLAGRPRRRGREKDRAQEAHHGRPLDRDLPGHARDPGCRRRLRSVRRYRCLRRRHRRGARHGRSPHGPSRCRSDHLDAGGNGKSVMLDTVAGIMGDYHTTAPIDTFTVSMGDRHPTELADLVGARLVTAIETEQGRAWAEARIKMLTGGDRVKARFMRQDFFEFRPQFKLMVAGNHQPVLRAVDEAIKRRFNLLPFEVTVPTAERDPDLAQKLRAEWPAILRWSLDGCLAWQRHGLQPPTAVTDATGRYLEAQDAMGAWLDEACEAKSTFRESASALYISWKAYADRNGEVAGSQKSFGPQLEARGFRRIKSAKANFYQGLRLVDGQPPTPPWPER